MRCNHSGPRGQCHKQSIDCSIFCETHSRESDRIMAYDLTNPELRASYEKNSQSGTLASIREEVALLRSMINRRVNFARNAAEEIVAFQAAERMMGTFDKLVNTLVKLERQSSAVLDKAAANKLAVDIGKILVAELSGVPDKDSVIDRVAGRIAQAVMAATNPID